MNFWQRTLITVLVFLATAGFFPTYFHVSSVWIACLAAIILGLLNMFVKPLLVILSPSTLDQVLRIIIKT